MVDILSDYKSELAAKLTVLSHDSPEVEEYAREAANCLQNDCYRASVILSWNVLMSYLYGKIESYGLSNFGRVARKKGIAFKGRINNRYDLNKLADSDLIETSHDIGIFDRNTKEQLKQMAITRNGSAHVTQLVVDELKAATFISELLNYVTIIKSSTIAKGANFVVQSILTFPNETTISKHVNAMSDFRRLISVVEAILDELQTADYGKLAGMSNYYFYLQFAIKSPTSTEKKRKLYERLHQRCLLSGSFPAQSWLLNLLEELLRDPAIRRFAVRKGMTGAYIANFASSSSYGQAEQSARILALFGAHLSKDQLNKMAEVILGNTQISDSWGAKRELKQLINARLNELNEDSSNGLKKLEWIT